MKRTITLLGTLLTLLAGGMATEVVPTPEVLSLRGKPWRFRPTRPQSTCATNPQTCPLVPADATVEFLGRFTVDNPDYATPALNWAYGGNGLGMGADGASLYMGAHDNDSKRLGRIPIPGTLAMTTLGTIVTQTQAPTFIANPYLAGDIDPGEENNIIYGGTLIDPDDSNRLIVSRFSYYDGASNAEKSHYVCTAAIGSCTGPYVIDQPGWTAGYMTVIPPAWRTLLGGKAFTGLNGVAVVARTSNGPSVTVFNPSDVGVESPIPSTRLLGYPEAHPTLGDYDSDPYGTGQWSKAHVMHGVGIVPNTRTLLFIGRTGTPANQCYGTGVDYQPPGSGECYDPAAVAGGVPGGAHAYPYAYELYLYDLNDLVAVKNGTMNYWEPVPYAEITLDAQAGTNIVYKVHAAWTSSTFDPATNRVYVTASTTDGNPTVHVWQLPTY